MFEKMKQSSQRIKAERKYPIPERRDDRYLYAGAKKGELEFFYSEVEIGGHKSNNSHRRFWLVPPKAEFVQFPDFRETKGGINYGKPEFLKHKDKRI